MLANRLGKHAVGALAGPVQQLSGRSATRWALNHDAAQDTLTQEANKMQQDDHDDGYTCQPQQQIPKHVLLLEPLA
jgi:hypothetical protein